MSAWSYRHWVMHAEQLAMARSQCWCDAQLEILDRLIDQLAHMYKQDAPVAFDADWFCDKARKGQWRFRNTITLRGGEHGKGQQHHGDREPDPRSGVEVHDGGPSGL